MENTMIVVAYEDRISSAVGLKLMVLSVGRSMPDVPIDLTCPKISTEVGAWLEGTGLTNVRVRPSREWKGEGWSVKPGKMLELLDEGHEEVVWIDTDIVANDDFRGLLRGLSPESVAVGQEFRARRPEWTRIRTTRWGLDFARELPHPMNLGFMRVTPAHRPLILKWQSLMETPRFLDAMKLPIAQRPPESTTDQDVFCALLGSSEFAHLPVHYLKSGDDIIQNSGANGYHVVERLRNVWRGLPPLIHMLGREKPWDYPTVPSPSRNPRDYFELVCIELSPYVTVSRRFIDQLGEPAPWLRVRTAAGKAFGLGSLGHHSLQGLPLAILAQCLSGIHKPQV
jgi:hypothetical protein